MGIVNKLIDTNTLRVLRTGTKVELVDEPGILKITKIEIYRDGTVVYCGYLFVGDEDKRWRPDVYCVDIKDYDKLINQNSQNLNMVTINDTSDSTTDKTMDTLSYVARRISNIEILLDQREYIICETDFPDGKTARELYDETNVRVIYNRNTTYGYLGDLLLLPNDTYAEIYHRENGELVLQNVLCRDVVLKPWYKRMWNTIKYGRTHIGNFDFIEDNDVFINRIKTTLMGYVRTYGYITQNKKYIEL